MLAINLKFPHFCHCNSFVILERKSKVIQAAAKKQIIALLQETLQKKQRVKQTKTTSYELYTIYEEQNVKDDNIKGLYFRRGGGNKDNTDDIIVNDGSAVFDVDADDDDSNKNGYDLIQQ